MNLTTPQLILDKTGDGTVEVCDLLWALGRGGGLGDDRWRHRRRRRLDHVRLEVARLVDEACGKQWAKK